MTEVFTHKKIYDALSVYKDRATDIWIVRDTRTHEEVAHEPTRRLACAAARKILNDRYQARL